MIEKISQVAMAEGDVQQVWRFEPRNYDPQESHAASQEILEDEDILTELDISDDHENGQVRVLLHQTADPTLYVYDGTDTGVTVDFNESLIQLKKAMADMVKMEEKIPAQQVRHCSLPWFGVSGQRNDGRLIRVSTWDENRAVRNLFLVAEDAKSALMLMNAVNRLIYETSQKSKPRTTQFQVIREGSINMAMSSAAERDQRDEIKLKQQLMKAEREIVGGEGSKSSVDDESMESLPALKDTEFYFVLDEEALCVYDHFACDAATHDFRFYREQTDKSVETIYACHDEDQLELQRGSNVFYLHPASTQQPDNIFQDLVNYLKAGHLRPKPEVVFKEVDDFNRFYSPVPEREFLRPPMMTMPPSLADQQQQREDVEPELSLPPISQAVPHLPFPSGSEPMKTDVQFPARAMELMGAGATAAATAAGPRDWLDQLNTGSHLLTAGEDMQMMWFGVEPELSEMISAGHVPTYNIDSAGLDPQSPEHLQRLIEEIKDELLKQNYGVALSHLRECMKVYGATLLSQLAAFDELDIMKRIYFLSG